MSNQTYNEGYQSFVQNGAMSPEEVKKKSSLFRAGYNAAVLESAQKRSDSLPTSIYSVKKVKKDYIPSYSDVLQATRLPQYARLHRNEMKNVLREVIRTIEDNLHKVKKPKDLSDMMKILFNILVENGYNLTKKKSSAIPV